MVMTGTPRSTTPAPETQNEIRDWNGEPPIPVRRGCRAAVCVVLRDVQQRRFTDVPVQIHGTDLEVERVLVVVMVEAIGEGAVRLECRHAVRHGGVQVRGCITAGDREDVAQTISWCLVVA